jgi:hypothetical protein
MDFTEEHPDNSHSDDNEIHCCESNYIEIENDLLNFHFDEILDIYYELKDRFYKSPYFINLLQVFHLTDFICNLLNRTKQHKPVHSSVLLKNFESYYFDEIDTSYRIVYQFLKNFKFTLDKNTWIVFCYKHSDLSGLVLFN